MGGNMYDYKVITLKNSYFEEGIDPIKVEQAINKYARLGWRIKMIEQIPISNKENSEMMILFEREI